MKAKNLVSFALLAFSFLLHSAVTHAAVSADDAPSVGSAAKASFAVIPPHLDDLRDSLCPSGESPRSMSVGDAQSWSCGPWTAVSAPAPATDGRPAGWVVSYSGVVQSGKAESIANAERECRAANATVTSQSATSIECRSAFDGAEQIMSYSKSAVAKPHVLFGVNWFETQQDRMTVTVTVQPLNKG